ncbi:hypothetical protein ALC62_02664 [Cyphomyrmex costatus]|uniref:Uncharacterized protein n=1 Tax=Cyphomyrmex costatus TaxID=456900 RepID=A0A195D0C9_9HYME|nr:hypothetical protein ALC62_02664 [Cyphomyrmex costatus]
MVPVPLFRLRSRTADRCTSSSTPCACSGRRVREAAEAPPPPPLLPPPTSVLFRCYCLSCSSCHQVPDTGCWLLVRHTGRAAINW